MVEIRRSRLNNSSNIRNPFGGSTTGGGGGGRSSSSSFGVVVRVLIVAVFGILGVRIIMPSSSSGTSNTVKTNVQPMGFDERLQDSKQQQQQPAGHIRKPSTSKQQQQHDQSPIKPHPPPSDSRDDNRDGEEEEDKDDADADSHEDHAKAVHDDGADAEDHGQEDRDDADAEDRGKEDHDDADANNEPNNDDEKQKKDDTDSKDGDEDNEKADQDEDDHQEVVKHDDEQHHEEQEDNDDNKKGNTVKKLVSPTSGTGKNPVIVEKKGTGPTDVGYVKDFVHERSNPAHRAHKVEVLDMSKDVASLVGETAVTPCETIVGDYLTAAVEMNSQCFDSDTPLIAYNPEKFPRTWCGQNISPGSAVTLNEHCTDTTVHLFPSVGEADVPPVSGDHMPPIIIKSKPASTIKDLSLDAVECNIPCRIEQEVKFGSGDLYIDGEESWTVTQAMHDSYYDASAKIERVDFMKDHYYSTQSFKSDVPLTYYDFGKYNLRDRAPVDYDVAKLAAIYLADSNCAASATKRSKYFGAIKDKMTVDSYGSCSHSKDVPDGIDLEKLDDRITLMREYRIVLAFDTASSKDHISPIIWEALISGSVPVVVGADNIREHLPKKSFINKSEFSNWDDLAEYVAKVVENKDLWESYQMWREDEEVIAAVEEKYSFSKTNPTCRLCRWAYAKKYGLGWNHQKQEVRDVKKVPKEKFCISANHGLVHKPFSEEWVSKGGDRASVLSDDSEGESCSSPHSSSDINIGSFSSHREVVYHDGVADYTLSGIKADGSEQTAVLRLSFPGIRNPDGAAFLNTHTTVSTIRGPMVSSTTIQDDVVKVSVIADWNTSIVAAGEGVIEIALGASSNDTKKRIRVIIEEMNAVHDKLTEFYPSSFYYRMAKDFIDPLPIFFAKS